MTPDTILIRPGLQIPDDELHFVATTGGGPGGQHVNRSQTRIELRFDLAHTTSLNEEQKAVISERLRGRISRDGILRVVSFKHRSQRQNREAAVDRFRELLAAALEPIVPRRPTRPTRASGERRLAGKKHRSDIKRNRKPPEG